MDRNCLVEEHEREVKAFSERLTHERAALPELLAAERRTFLEICSKEQAALPRTLEQEGEAAVAAMQAQRAQLLGHIERAQTMASTATHPVEQKAFERDLTDLKQKLRDVESAHSARMEEIKRRASTAAAELEDRQVDALRRLDARHRVKLEGIEREHQEQLERLRVAQRADFIILDCLEELIRRKTMCGKKRTEYVDYQEPRIIVTAKKGWFGNVTHEERTIMESRRRKVVHEEPLEIQRVGRSWHLRGLVASFNREFKIEVARYYTTIQVCLNNGKPTEFPIEKAPELLDYLLSNLPRPAVAGGEYPFPTWPGD